MVAGSLDLDRLAVEEEALFGVKAQGAYSKRCLHGIDALLSLLQDGDNAVESRRFQRPEARRIVVSQTRCTLRGGPLSATALFASRRRTDSGRVHIGKPSPVR